MKLKSGHATYILIGSSMLWGLSWIPLKYLAQSGVEGMTLILISYLTLFIMMLPFTSRNFQSLRGHALPMMGICVIGGLSNLCFTYALIHGEVVRVMVLFYLLPVWGVLGGRFILKEATDLWRWCGVGLAVIGAFILLGGNNILSQPPQWIDLIALLSGLFLAANNIIFRSVEQVPLNLKLHALYIGCFAIAGLMLLLGLEPLGSGISWQGIFGCVAYALLWLFWATIGSQWAVTQMPAGRSSIIIITELVIAVISATLIGGEHITLNVFIGGVLIVSASAIEIFRSNSVTH
jgi:drug/metabolite transporter (DMT)-like permease